MLPKKEYMITTRSDRQTDRLLFKKRSRSRPEVRGLLLIILLILTTAPVVADTGSLRAIVSNSNAPLMHCLSRVAIWQGGSAKIFLKLLPVAAHLP